MQTFEHNGTKIELTENGKFRATVGGQTVRKPSLKAMRDYIDDAAKKNFEPVTVLIRADWRTKTEARVKGTDLTRAEIVSVRETKNRFPKGLVFLDNAGQMHARVFADSKEAIAAAQALESHHKESKRIKDERGKEADRLEKALMAFALKPEDYKTERKAT